jgi:hypothetical protein
MKDSFAGYGNLGWQLFSFRAWDISFYDLLAFGLSIEKFDGFALYMTYCFSLAALESLFFSVCLVFQQ